MAIKTLTEINAGLFADKVYHGELELNQVAFPFTGRIEAQTPLCAKANDADFVGEVGMILVVDKWAKDAEGNDIPAEVRPVKDTDDEYSLFALNYSTETNYDERARGLRYFHQIRGTGSYDWLGNGDQYDIYPRLGVLSKNDRFTTSSIDVKFNDEGDQTIKDALAEFKGKLLVAGKKGYWEELATGVTPVGPVVRVVDPMFGMPDGSYGFRLEVVKA